MAIAAAAGFCIYATMFDDAIATRLGRFWGIELSPAPVDKVVHSF